jgi:hypothetical protein
MALLMCIACLKSSGKVVQFFSDIFFAEFKSSSILATSNGSLKG